MPKPKVIIDTLPFGPKPKVGIRPTHSVDKECPIATLIVRDFNARLTVKTTKPMLWITMPYEDYEITYTVTPDLYDCIGWRRKEHDFIVTVTDGVYVCQFIIPGTGVAE